MKRFVGFAARISVILAMIFSVLLADFGESNMQSQSKVKAIKKCNSTDCHKSTQSTESHKMIADSHKSHSAPPQFAIFSAS